MPREYANLKRRGPKNLFIYAYPLCRGKLRNKAFSEQYLRGRTTKEIKL
jgi:hypothetical protein